MATLAQQQYNRSEKAKDAQQRYKRSAKGRATRAAWHARRRGLPETREYSRLSSDLRRERVKEVFRPIIDAFLAQPCVDCGKVYPRPAMHPDHVRGVKKYKIAWFYGGNGSLRTLQIELAKCDPRCANCHCIRHAAERQ